ncbi:MAG: HAD family hydrolase [Acidimicrobiia bacterium]
MPTRPHAVLLDVGGVFHLPSRARVAAALARSGYQVTDDKMIDRAHYVAVRVFPFDEAPDLEHWDQYVETYARSFGFDEPELPGVLEHLEPEFATAGLWSQVVEGSRAGLEELIATGVAVGVVSNSDGAVAERLRSQGVLQVGPGPGVEVRCVIDSGQVGVAKPDPRIFEIALDILGGVAPEQVWYVGDTPGIDVVGARRAGIHPVLMDPFRLYRDIGVDAVESLGEVAAMLASP